MYAEMDKVLTFQPFQNRPFWHAMFSYLHILLGVIDYKNSQECLHFIVLPFG